SVKLSSRYIPARQLPDKSVSLLDTACARVAVSQHATPAEVEDSRRRIEALETELEIIGREKAVGVDTAQREAAVDAELAAERERLAQLESRWTTERNLVEKILALRAELRRGTGKVEGTDSALESAADRAAASGGAAGSGNGSGGGPALSEEERAALLAELRELQAELAELQGESPLI